MRHYKDGIASTEEAIAAKPGGANVRMRQALRASNTVFWLTY
jgi:hypothetical protein